MPDTNNLVDEITLNQIQDLKLGNVCYQLATRGKWPLKSYFNSTSFFISKNFLLTSAHNVEKTFRTVNFLDIAPARVGEEYHFGRFSMATQYASSFKVYPDYQISNRSTRSLYDIALIYVPDNILNQNPSFVYENSLPLLNDISYLSVGDEVFCAGYPASNQHLNRYRMTLDKSEILKIEEHSFTHNLTTETGNSGSPIMVKRNNKFYVIGVNSIKSSGTLINDVKKNWIEASMADLMS